MANTYQKWIEFLYGPILKVIGSIYRIYKANRERIKSLTARKMVSSLIRNGAVIILLAWILIWFFASDESRVRLTQEVQKSLGIPGPHTE